MDNYIPICNQMLSTFLSIYLFYSKINLFKYFKLDINQYIYNLSLLIMKSKVVIPVAQAIAALKILPESMYPSTIKHNIMLPKLSEIRVYSGKVTKECFPIFQFYRKYCADIRFHNPDLKCHRVIQINGPIIAQLILVPKDNIEPIIIDSTKARSVQQLKDKIIQAHSKI